MRYKTLMALAVAGAVGWSASAFSGSAYEVSTPSSANETGPVALQMSSHLGSTSTSETPMVLSSSETYLINDEAVGATVADSGSGSIGSSMASEDLAGLSDEDVLALADEGFYSDFYRVSYTPMADYYVLDVTPVEYVTLALGDSYTIGDEGAVTRMFDDGSILQVFDDGSLLAFDEGYGIPAASWAMIVG